MSFATSVRVHPVDNFILTTVVFIVLLPLGPPVKMVVPFYFVMELLIDLQHTEIPWRFGPLYRLVVSPAFHSIHHSASPEHHNRHFGRSLSIWDYLFGTAVHGHARPVAFGLEGWKAPTLASQLCSPFARAYRAIVPTHHPERCSRAMSAAPEQVAFPSEAER
jgi:sterol desaturase/sphingolipid hydroxylase (fatty acid hydroxylase superfamily)